LELVIVDDGSSDGSIAICDTYATKDARVRVIKHESNCGIVVALNRGINESRGELIARMDADDVSLPTRLMEQVGYLDKNMDIDIVGTGVEVFTTAQPSPTVTTTTSSTLEQKAPLSMEAIVAAAAAASGAKTITPTNVINKPRLIRTPPSPGLVHLSMFFYCCIAHPTIVARRHVFKVHPTILLVSGSYLIIG
jgi:glycosyltransferase involved in cell wall biosynthesis